MWCVKVGRNTGIYESPTPLKQWCGCFTYGFLSLSEKTRKSTWSNRLQMLLERQHFLLSYLKSLSVVPVGVRTRDLPLSRPALPHCLVNQGALNLRTVLKSKTGFRNLKWFPSSVALTVSCLWGCKQKKEWPWERLALTQRTLGRVSEKTRWISVLVACLFVEY